MEEKFLTEEEKEELARGNIKLAYYFVDKYDYLPFSFEDKLSAAMLGMVKALNKFDTNKGIKFSTFYGKIVHFEMLQIGKKENRHLNTISIDKPISKSDGGKVVTLLDTLVDDKKDWSDINNAMNEVVKGLSTKQKEIFSLFLQGRRQKEIGEIVGAGQARVSKVIKRSYLILKQSIGEKPKGVGEMILSSQYRGHKRIHIRRQSKRELVKAIQELEKRGFECVIPVREAKEFGKNFKDKAKFYQGKWLIGRTNAVDSYEQVYYETIMRLKSE